MSELSDQAWQAAQDDDDIRGAALERLVKGFHKIEKFTKSLPELFGEAQKKQIALTTDELNKSLEALRESIKGLPQDLDQQTANMQAFIFESTNSVDTKIKELEFQVEHINSNALSIVSNAMLSSVSSFSKNMTEAKEVVLSDFKSNLEEYTKSFKDDLEETTKKILEDFNNQLNATIEESNLKEGMKQVEGITRQSAWIIIGVTSFISVATLVINIALLK